MLLKFDFNKILLLINPEITKEYFIEKSGARDGYALNMFSRIYESIYSELINVDTEFEKYYSFEYLTLEKFLLKKFNITLENIEKLIEQRKKYPDCVLFRKEEYSYGDYGITGFAFSDTMKERIFNILMQKIEL